MRRFELEPAPTDAPLREVAEVMEGVERAKTSMRTLGKYVPMDLVRELYAANREPQLGGELVDLSMMFTDIEGFTGLSERLAPDALAVALGAYLEAMTAGVRSVDGTVDKFIGDAVMAFWNAPRRVPDHALRACRAVLACMKTTRALYASPAWEGLPPLFTRYGVHTARVLVGHFGAPERFSYTALGDGVNLAARLEPLCKQYGVAALVSEAVVAAVARDLGQGGAGGGMAFRRIDKVAVKGKQQAVRGLRAAGRRAHPDGGGLRRRLRGVPGARLRTRGGDPGGHARRSAEPCAGRALRRHEGRAACRPTGTACTWRPRNDGRYSSPQESIQWRGRGRCPQAAGRAVRQPRRRTRRASSDQAPGPRMAIMTRTTRYVNSSRPTRSKRP